MTYDTQTHAQVMYVTVGTAQLKAELCAAVRAEVWRWSASPSDCDLIICWGSLKVSSVLFPVVFTVKQPSILHRICSAVWHNQCSNCATAHLSPAYKCFRWNIFRHSSSVASCMLKSVGECTTLVLTDDCLAASFCPTLSLKCVTLNKMSWHLLEW